ncbi:MAG: AMP-binding protein [Thermoguttaceae bacterium]|nr:AMP-binding protein [Thermoguttaceae bacterium]
MEAMDSQQPNHESLSDPFHIFGFDASFDRSRWLVPARRLIRICRHAPKKWKIADIGGSLTGGELLLRVLIFRRLLRREILSDDEQRVGVLIPPTMAAATASYALTLDRRVPVHLNYTLSSTILNHCIKEAGIRHILTSQKVLDRFPDLKLDAELILLENYVPKLTLWDKLSSLVAAKYMPIGMLEKWLGLDQVKPDDLHTIIFTSGSTGMPKGVMLSHWNVLRNAESMSMGVVIRGDDVIVGALPFFHAYGYTVPLWIPTIRDASVIFHANPLDAQTIGRLCQKYRGTYFLATPTFARAYLRRCKPEDLATVDMMVLGAEKMTKKLADEYEAKFGVRPLEGFGATELSPVVSVNLPPNRSVLSGNYCKEGTIGRPLPGLTAKVVDPETFVDRGRNQEGMLLIRGDTVMQGYLNLPEQTRSVLRDGWYVTGDMAIIDEEGFVQITGRLSRFSKLGGEMVPHLRIEEMLYDLLHLDDAADGDAPTVPLAVTAVPDAKKGEKIIVLHTMPIEKPDELCHAMSAAGLPNLWIPSADAFYQVESLPLLGTGKLDLQGLKKLALTITGQA